MPEAKATSRVWFITGSSTGFGRTLAEELLQRGERVIATARDLAKIEDLQTRFPGTARVLALDVTDLHAIESVAQQAISAFGQVDVLVNNAGYGINGAIEEVSEQEFEPVMQTNLYGTIRTTRAFLPHFRSRGKGHIFNLSSIGGLIGTAGWGFYNVTKFGVEGFSEALAEEMKPFGVHVTVVEPGPFRTDFLGRSGKVATRVIGGYEKTAGVARAYIKNNDGKQAGDPQKAVEAMIQVADSPEPPVHLLLGKSALKRFRARLALWQESLNSWESVTDGADYPESN